MRFIDAVFERVMEWPSRDGSIKPPFVYTANTMIV